MSHSKALKGIPHVSCFLIKILGKKVKFLNFYMTEIQVRRMGGNQATFCDFSKSTQRSPVAI